MLNFNRSSLKDLGKAWLQSVKDKAKCSVCSENHPACLEFHHVNPLEKKGTLSQLVKQAATLEELNAELNKCICLCSNCHKKVHAGDLHIIGKPELPAQYIHRVWNRN